MQKGDIFEAEVVDINNLGFGICKINGMVIFVSGGVTGDFLEIKIIKCAKSYSIGRIEKIIKPSEYRVSPDCSINKRCGGCSFLHINYEYELNFKKKFVKDAFYSNDIDIEVADVVTNNIQTGYRNKVIYPVQNNKIGYYAKHSHEIICSNEICRLESPILNSTSSEIKEYITNNIIPGLKHIYMRVGIHTSQILICFILDSEKSIPGINPIVNTLIDKFPNIKSIYANINPDDTNVILGQKFFKLFGEEFIEDYLCGNKYYISPASFYQVNNPMADIMYSYAADTLKVSANEKIVDLFCGIGTIGITMASKAPGCKLTGIEIVSEAIENAKLNAKINNINNAEFICGDANNNRLLDSDAIIVDPPRKGLNEDLISKITKSKANRVLYISCNPLTMARDCRQFKENGFRFDLATPFDMFPNTGHVETVVLLSRI